MAESPISTPAGRLGALRAVSARPALRRLQIAWAGAYAGEAISTVAFGVIAYRAGGPGAVALLVTAQMLPSALLSPLLTSAGERFHRERLVLAVDSLRTAVAAGATVLAAVGAPRVALLALAAAVTVTGSVSTPVRRALVPLLVGGPVELTAAGVVASVVQAAAQTVGPLVAGVLFVVAHAPAVLAAATACFAVAVVAEAGLPSTAGLAVRPTAMPSRHVARAMRRGATTVWSVAQLRFAAGLFAAKNLGRGALNVLLVVVPLTLLGLGGSGVGWLTAAVGGGGVLGGLAAAWLVGRRHMATPMVLGLVVWGVPLAALGGEPHLAVAIAGLLVIGAGNTLTDVAGYTLIARSARDDVLASVYAVHEAVRALAICAGSGIVALVIELAGERASLLAAGAFLVVAAGLGALRRRGEVQVDLSPDDLRVVRSNPLFGWLPPVALERVAAMLVSVDVSAGEVLLREGDPGDRAFLVAEGELVAERGGREIGRIEPGAVVGEIALLHDAPRMATVRALRDCRLLAIDRDEFLAAATGSAYSREASEALVANRLAVLAE